MPRRERASNRNHQPRSRVEEWEKLARELAEHEKAVASVRERMQALGRRDPNDPNDKPENDTYVRIDDLVEGAPITGRAAARPKLTVWWSEEQVTEWMRTALRIQAYFAAEKQRTGRRVLEKDGVPYIMQHKCPRGQPISGHVAKVMFTLCRDAEDMTGGLVGKKNGVKGSTLEPLNP
jgi:hypothetical protein